MAGCDPNFTDVGLLYEFVGTAGQTSGFVDSSSNNFSSSETNTTLSSSLASPSGQLAATFNGSSSAIALAVGAGGPLDISSGDFTIEAWVYPSSSANMVWFSLGNSSTLGVFLQFNGLTAIGQAFIGTAPFNLTITTPLTINTWNHIALVRQGSTLTYYLNGVGSVQTTIYTGSMATPNALELGAIIGSAPTYQGALNQVRVTKGIARYTANFAAPTAAFPTMQCGSATVPDIVGDTASAANAAIVAATLTVGTVTSAFSTATPGTVTDQSPGAGSAAAAGDPVSYVLAMPFPLIVVPNVIGESLTTGSQTLAASDLTTGTVTSAPDSSPLNTIIGQSPAAGTQVNSGTAVNLIVSQGPADRVMPDVVGLLLAPAGAAVANVGIPPAQFLVTFASSDTVFPGEVISQTPAPGTVVNGSTIATVVISTGVPITEAFDYIATVISQFQNSPTLLQLVTNMAQNLRQDVNMQAFFDYVWNVNTAVGFGLDIWGRIVDISRLLQVPNDAEFLGFQNNENPPGVLPFNNGVWNSGSGSISNSFLLPDDAYRTLILTKALANISNCSARSINQLLQNLFPGRGNAYVLDLGQMRMQFTFEFTLTQTEFAILSQSGALPHGAGVQVSIVSIPGGNSPLLEFKEQGAAAETFGNGVFYQPAV